MGGSLTRARGVKRPLEEERTEETSDERDGESELHTPKRKRYQSTSKYIVKTLFEEGSNSDVTIHTLGKEWHLHRLYLCQCKYFDSMFNGAWMESGQSAINMEISDENINSDALKIAFKSLYTDNVFVKPVQAVGVLAAATFLQLDPLIDHCRTVMKSCIMSKTVCSFLTAGEQYGLVDVKNSCLTWLHHCVMTPGTFPVLSEISEELLVSLLDSQDLWLLQVEVDVYTLLKKWLFLHMNPSWNSGEEELYNDCKDFFKNQAQESGCCFLETDVGRRFIPMFEKVRWMYVINDLSAIQLLKDDQIIPMGWLDPYFKFCWLNHLKSEQGCDTGPEELSEEDFYKHAMRCGRIMVREQEYHWRWLGYQYGLDLLFTLRNKVITVRRNIGSQHKFQGSLSQQKIRKVMLHLKVAQIKKKDKFCVTGIKTTGISNLYLSDDDVEFFLLTLDQNTKFPLQVTMHLLYITPNPSLPFPSLAVPPPPVTVVPSPPLEADNNPPPSSLLKGSGDGARQSTESGSQNLVAGDSGVETDQEPAHPCPHASSESKESGCPSGLATAAVALKSVVASLEAPRLSSSLSSASLLLVPGNEACGQRVPSGVNVNDSSADFSPPGGASSRPSEPSSPSSAGVDEADGALLSQGFSSAMLSAEGASSSSTPPLVFRPPTVIIPSSSSSSSSVASPCSLWSSVIDPAVSSTAQSHSSSSTTTSSSRRRRSAGSRRVTQSDGGSRESSL